MILFSGIIFLYLFSSIYSITYDDLEIGDSCPDNKGVCTLVTSCPEAVEKLKQRQKPGLDTCGFQGILEIVCCPSKTKFATIDPRSGIKEACEKYSKTYTIDLEPSIIRGENVSLGDFPYMAAIGYPFPEDRDNQTKWLCGGMLISERFILTAAHCIVRVDNKTPNLVRLGKIDLFGDLDNAIAQDIPVEEIIVHPDYQHINKRNDIALLRLARPAEFNNNVKAVCLNTRPKIETGLLVLGWGVINRDTDETSRFLQKAFVEPYDLNKCNQSFYNPQSAIIIDDTQLCALGKGPERSDSCQGDSGGPLQIQNLKANGETPLIVVGVTSFGRGCGANKPSIYTRISSYLDWIGRIVWPSN